ncbi:polycystic kidney disease 2-like 1 protein [Lingula anatina]|uniref:Polycystic kidney disease 2-like 1 protein n=1 Tax=Lingula anatina TaxID=7574 RepID=A0A1S3IFB0_LINAN|nr:polycystic kidney disease 2-like 1 protein [Lingula anatina]|eukprot:XP_013396541.2 polycystic kidney disease 2-like 1 protein [Lingula anatina]
MAPYVTACRAPYNYLDEDQAAYGEGWRALNNSADSNSPNAWGFQSAIDLASYPFMGDKTWYGGGGYVADLGSSEATARTTIERLFQERWVDLFTRAVFVEFVLYNANKNVFIVSQIVIEFLETGGAFPNPRFHVFRLDRYVGPFMYVIMAAEILTACFTLYFLVLEFKKLRNERCQYFTGFWNVVEAILVSLILVTVVIFVYKLVSATLLMDEIRENPDTFHNMQYAVLWDELYSFLLGFIVFLANLKFLKLLRFNKRTSMLADVLRETAKPLAYFMAMFCIVFMGFVSCAYLLFSSKLLNYMNVVSVAETLLVMVLNKFDYSAVAEADGTLGPIFFLCYVVMVSFILINMFLSIIMEAFTMVRQDLDRQSNDYEIVQFMVQRLKAFIGVGGERANQNTVNSVYYEEVAGSGYRSENAEELNQKLESLLGHLTGIFYTDTQSKEVLKTGPEKKKKKQLFSSD